MSTILLAFLIVILAILGLRHFLKAKGSCGDCQCHCPVKQEMQKSSKD